MCASISPNTPSTVLFKPHIISFINKTITIFLPFLFYGSSHKRSHGCKVSCFSGVKSLRRGLKSTIVLLLHIRRTATVLFSPTQTWKKLQSLLQDAYCPADSGLAGPELSSELKWRYKKRGWEWIFVCNKQRGQWRTPILLSKNYIYWGDSLVIKWDQNR